MFVSTGPRMLHLCCVVMALLALLPSGLLACSNFAMENRFGISVRTEDSGDQPVPFKITTVPKGTTAIRSSAFGYVAFTQDYPGKLINETGIKGGINTAGLSCDKQTLIDSMYPNRTDGKLAIYQLVSC